VSLALDLYYKHNGRYPPPGSDLSQELGPFVQNPKVFISPLTGGKKDLSAMYESLTLAELDEPENYVAAFFDDDGETAVILKTLGKIVRKTDLRFNPDIPLSAKFAIVTAVGLDNGDETAVASQTLDAGEDSRVVDIAKYTLDCATQDKTGVEIQRTDVGDEGNTVLPAGVAGEDGIVFEAEDGDQLGGVAGTDTFEITINDDADPTKIGVEIALKAGRETFKLPAGLPDTSLAGLQDETQRRGEDGIPLVDENGNEDTGWSVDVSYSDEDKTLTVTFEVSTDGTTNDLSNIEFTLSGGVDILEVAPVRRTLAAPQ
jgi:hypothetical protein